jgi:hypothetical protein
MKVFTKPGVYVSYPTFSTRGWGPGDRTRYWDDYHTDHPWSDGEDLNNRLDNYDILIRPAHRCKIKHEEFDKGELEQMLKQIRISTLDTVNTFRQWKYHDGSRDGLLALVGLECIDKL